ncbi:MerR family transcriptional regulator, partial [Phascolarctobacterium succinatutens]
MKDSRYFTPAELAKLFGISKQLLLYYDKNDIFSPEFVDENGYRFYVLSQYFTLQIIISLRKLDVSLKEIKAYLKSKDINLLKDIYRNKQQEYKKQIEELLYLEKTMQQKISFLNDIQNLPLNQILLELQEEEHLYFSEDISFQTPIKHRMNILAKHMLPVFSHPSFQEYLMGFHYDSNEFFYEGLITQYNVFISANSKLHYNNPIKKTKEKGLY